MIDVEIEQSAIVSIACIPKTRLLYSYIINDGEMHTMKNDDLRKWLGELVQPKKFQINDFVYKFAYFIVMVPSQEVEELQVNANEERQRRKEEIRQTSRTQNFKILERNTVSLSSRYIYSSASNEKSSELGLARLLKQISSKRIG